MSLRRHGGEARELLGELEDFTAVVGEFRRNY
jgi:hypothetical protein